MTKKEVRNLINLWEDYTAKQTGKDRFVLNPNMEKVKKLALGVLYNEKKHGLKYCPCRITTGNKEKDMALICGCNFKSQKCWSEVGECWCSLFVRKRK